MSPAYLQHLLLPYQHTPHLHTLLCVFSTSSDEFLRVCQWLLKEPLLELALNNPHEEKQLQSEVAPSHHPVHAHFSYVMPLTLTLFHDNLPTMQSIHHK